MSYIVLARKWRPQNFDDLVGQETVTRTIKNALSNDKTVHAYLFSGPRGVGKTSAARILAKALNCTEGPAAEPCGKCRNCLSISSGSSVDILEIDGASNNSVEDVRQLRESVKYAPSACKYKIYIIDEVHMLSKEAFNALLKTLEEPPSHVIFVFATTEPKKVPVTILSRCQHHSFRKIPKEKIKERLLKITQSENIKVRESALEMIARAADGSMRDALTVLDQAASFSDDITERELQTLLGLPESDIVLSLSETILSGDISGTLSIIKDLTERGYDLRPIIKELVGHFRDLAIVKITRTPDEFTDSTKEEAEQLQRQASRISIEELTMLLSELLKLEAEVKSAINPRYTLELGLLKTTFIKGMTSIGDILTRLDRSGLTYESVPTAGTNKEAIAPPASPEIREHASAEISPVQDTLHKTDFQSKDALWSGVVEKFKSSDSLLACKLAEAKIMNITGHELIIGLNGGMSVLTDSVKKNAQAIETAIQDLTGHKLRLKIVSIADEKKSINEVKEKVLSDPVVKSALELFNGTILEVRSLENKRSV